MSSWSTGTNVIKEVDTNKNLTCQMFEVRKQGGGTEYLVRKSDVTLGTKSVTQNGTYTAASDGKYGFSQFSVNVRGGNGSVDSQGKPNTSSDIKPGGAGSAVTGTDPETGEEVVVGVDEDGNIVHTPIPYGIKIVTPPTKTDYVYQETMDYSGIGVKLTNKNGDTYTDVDHPSGWYVNPADLIFPVDKAPAAGSGGSGGGAAVPVVSSASEITPGNGLYTYDAHDTKYYTGSNVADTQFCSVGGQQSSGMVLWASPNSGSVFWHTADNRLETKPMSGYDSTTGLYYHYGAYESATNWASGIPNYDTLEEALSAIAQEHRTVTIPVKWLNPYTGETRQDTFEITSTAASGDAHTSTGSSGTEGSGGGGTF